MDTLESMNDREIDLVLQGKARLRVVVNPEAQKKLPLDDSRLEKSVSEMAQKLNDAESREAAHGLFANINQPRRRAFLILLANACDVNVGSKDNMARIEQKLVESVVGAKLRSQAIKNVAF